MLQAVLIALALIALFGVVFEEKIKVSKAKITLMCGCLAWVLLFLASPGDAASEHIGRAFEKNVAEIANLWLFLIAAMTFVAYLNKKGLIDNAIHLILPRRMRQRGLLFLTGLFCFVFSSLADNITATLVSVALVLSLKLGRRDTVKFAVMVVFAVNSGGVALISGDVTTLMIFLAGKVGIGQLLLLSLPALLAVLLLAALLSYSMSDVTQIQRHETSVRRVDILIAVLFLMTIVSTMLANAFFKVPPVLSFLTGLAVMFLVARFYKDDIDEDPILEYIRLVEFETLFFFLGVLLIVGMLQQIGVLDAIGRMYLHIEPGAANYLVGLLSALIDNVPLTAALLKADLVMSPGEWMTLTYCVGVGGSLLVIGSAAGIVCMSKVPGLTVSAYLRYCPHVLIAYSFGFVAARAVGEWLL